MKTGTGMQGFKARPDGAEARLAAARDVSMRDDTLELPGNKQMLS
jgi:hypothetical protein